MDLVNPLNRILALYGLRIPTRGEVAKMAPSEHEAMWRHARFCVMVGNAHHGMVKTVTSGGGEPVYGQERAMEIAG